MKLGLHNPETTSIVVESLETSDNESVPKCPIFFHGTLRDAVKHADNQSFSLFAKKVKKCKLLIINYFEKKVFHAIDVIN